MYYAMFGACLPVIIIPPVIWSSLSSTVVVMTIAFASVVIGLMVTLSRSNIVILPSGINFNVPQLLEFVKWENIQAIGVENERLVVLVSAHIMPPNIRRKRRVTLRIEGPDEAVDVAKRYMNQRAPLSDAHMSVDESSG